MECILIMLDLLLTNYCVRYPHAVPFLSKEMSFFLPKPPKIHAVYEVVAF